MSRKKKKKKKSPQKVAVSQSVQAQPRPRATKAATSFKNIQFGFASAEAESADAPQLLLNAFLDPEDHVKEIVGGRRFIILGPKGSGKSAIGLHLQLDSQRNPTRFVSTHFLKDLSYQTLGSIVQGEIEPELRFPRAWSFVILLMLISSLARDEGATFVDPNQFLKTVDGLRDTGLLPTDDLSALVGRMRFSKYEVSAFNIKLIASGESHHPEILLSTLTQHLKDLIASSSTASRHLLIIDGLDDVLLGDAIQLQALSGLILESSRLNQFFRERGLPFKIVVLCRTDIYERIPGPNQNKIRQDLAVDIHWYESESHKSPLVQLARLRARLANPSLNDFFAEVFPKRLTSRPLIGALLNYTRHTPRDFLQLLRYLQDAADVIPVEHATVYGGLKDYAERYFVPEIRDELDGVIPREEFDRFMASLFQFPASIFSFEQLQAHLKRLESVKNLDLQKMLPALYSCGALGNVSKKDKYRWQYALPGSMLIREDNMIFHPALRMALGMPKPAEPEKNRPAR